jgi:endoglucanase
VTPFLRVFSALYVSVFVWNLGAAAQSPTAARIPATGQPVTFDPHLLVDQFGYRPADLKVAVLRDPREGYDKASTFTPGPQYEVRRSQDGSVVLSGKPSDWHGGAVDPSAGDRGWWFDFSELTAPGSYFIYDADRKVRSAPFTIDQHVYRNVLKAAMRMFYYQRSGISKKPPYADPCWADSAAYAGAGQDTQARDITDRDNSAKIRNLGGGWFDAGDTNKYVTFAAQPVHQLLTAYEESPAVFTDDFNIPESGNGVPDVLDEVRWETDWLKRMQYPDGSAALKVGEIVYGPAAPPSSDHASRFYIPACSSSTIAVAGMFAHAAYTFGRIPGLAQESADLKSRALAAWDNYQHVAVKQTKCDTGVVHSGIADWSEADQQAAAAVAAIYLFAVTGDAKFNGYVQSHYRDLWPYHANEFGWSRYKPEQGEALLFYTRLQSVADSPLSRSIKADKLHDVRTGKQVYGFRPDDDLYRAFMHTAQYHWGSNNPRAGYGNTNMDVITYGIDPPGNAGYSTRAVEVLHYFHGVNPFAMVYLTNMYAYGATRSANEIFHSWFAAGSRWSDALSSECGPAPGYVPGGPNLNAGKDGVPASLAPPVGQPPQKSYLDWNKGPPDTSWAVTEPAIYYQSGYVKLLAKFAD